MVSTTALTLFFLTMGDHHKHSEETPEYEFLKRASRVCYAFLAEMDEKSNTEGLLT